MSRTQEIALRIPAHFVQDRHEFVQIRKRGHWLNAVISVRKVSPLTIASLLLSIVMIWTPHDEDVFWKALATNGVVFFASLLVMVITRVFAGMSSGRSDK